VKKSEEEQDGDAENKGVSESSFVKSEQKCEVAENAGFMGSERWAGEWCDAVRLREGVDSNTNQYYHKSYVLSSKIKGSVGLRFVAERRGSAEKRRAEFFQAVYSTDDAVFHEGGAEVQEITEL
jgi:hypothetical protein